MKPNKPSPLKLLILEVLLTILVGKFVYADISYFTRVNYNYAQHIGDKSGATEYKVIPSGLNRIGLTLGVENILNPYFAYQFEIQYNQKGSHEVIGVSVGQNSLEFVIDYYTEYIELPVLLKIRIFEWNNVTNNILLGAYIGYLTNGKYSLIDPIYNKTWNESINTLDRWDYGIISGGEFTLTIGDKNLFLDYRFSFGIPKGLYPTYFGQKPVELRNYLFSAGLGYRF